MTQTTDSITNGEEFARLVAADPALKGPVDVACVALESDRAFGVDDLAAIALLYPIARYIIVEIGLPWLHSTGRYIELYRQKFDSWVDEKYVEHGLDPVTAKQAGDSLRRQLEQTTGLDKQQSWERLQILLKQGSSGNDT